MIEVSLPQFKNALECVLLRGKYKSSTVSKISIINECAVAMLNVEDQKLTISNASDTIAAQYTIQCICNNHDANSLFFFDLQKTLKYLNNFKDNEEIRIITGDGKLILENDYNKASIPLDLEHRNIGFISKLQSMEINHDDMPTFNLTKLEAQLICNGKDLKEAIKKCSTVGTATYKIDWNTDNEYFVVSSTNFHKTETYSTKVDLISGVGESTTVEFSAPIDKFCSDTMWLYLKDDCPILLVGLDRRLVMAPYIRVI